MLSIKISFSTVTWTATEQWIRGKVVHVSSVSSAEKVIANDATGRDLTDSCPWTFSSQSTSTTETRVIRHLSHWTEAFSLTTISILSVFTRIENINIPKKYFFKLKSSLKQHNHVFLPHKAMHKCSLCCRLVSVCLSVTLVHFYPDGWRYRQTSLSAR